MSAVPLVFLYVLTALPLLKAVTVATLQQLRPVVQLTDQEYDQHLYRIVCVDLLRELLLLTASASVVILLLVVLRVPTPIGGGVARLPEQWGAAAFIVTVYILLGWLLLLLLYSSIRLGTGLALLAQRPVTINVFDSTRILPFGNLALRHSLTVAGLILVLIIPLGRPTELIDYLVIGLLSLGSLLTLIMPLRGLQIQIGRAKAKVLHHLSDQFYQIQTTLLDSDQKLAPEELTRLSKSADELDHLRKLALASPTWPFRNVSAVIRAMLTAVSPLLYFIITELMRTYVLPLLTG